MLINEAKNILYKILIGASDFYSNLFCSLMREIDVIKIEIEREIEGLGVGG
jgi:hypothetical protein